MTVREALNFAAQLLLPKTMGAAEKARRALGVARALNLDRALDSLVGSSMLKGIRCVYLLFLFVFCRVLCVVGV